MHCDWISKWAGYAPEKIAVKEHESGRTLTYRKFNQLANQLSHHVTREYGLNKGDRIAVLAENCLEYFLLFAVAQKTRIILVPLNYRLTSYELRDVLSNADPRLLIFEDKYRENLRASSTFKHSIPRLSVEALSNSIANFGEEDCDFPEACEVSENDPIFILYTSGTTGLPKGVIYTHKMLFWNSINTALALDLHSESRTIHCLPPFHTGGWNVLTTPVLHHGGFICLLRKFDPATVLNLLPQERISLFMGVPTMLRKMSEQDNFRDIKIPDLKYMIVGGEQMPIPLIEKWHEKKIPVRQGFGMTEVGPNLTSLHQYDAIRKQGSIGKPNFYLHIKIIDSKGDAVGPDQTGELLLSGPVVTPGYWNDVYATNAAIKEGWFYSGDLVRRDNEGYLYVVDRIKNMFISGGENVYPAEIERIVLSFAAVAEAAVIGVPDETWGEVGKLFVVAEQQVKLDLTELLQYCGKKLAKYKIPKHTTVLAELPKNETGKIDRKALAALG